MSALIQLSFRPDFLRFRFPFRIAHGERLGTDVVFVNATCHHLHGYGEAALPPYLPYTAATTMAWLSRIAEHETLSMTESPSEVSHELAKKYPGQWPALCALDSALWQLHARALGKPLAQFMPFPEKQVPHTFTIGISTEAEVEQKVAFASSRGYTLFKLKMDGVHDAEMVRMFRKYSDAPFAVDANQAWDSFKDALRTTHLLKEAGAILVEQPFHRDDLESMGRLSREKVLPVIADESCQTAGDIARLHTHCDGVNIKLQKCGGLSFALGMLQEARSLGMQVLVGCMSESATGIAPAEVLASGADWADLDGPDLIVESPDPA